MLKRFSLALAGLFVFVQLAAAAGTINLSLSQRLDNATHLPLAGGKLYFFQAGTTTPQIAYQDTALTIPLPGGSIYTLDANGSIPQFFLPDGSIKIRLDNALGVPQLAADNVLVIGPSSGSGGGSTVDPTTIMQTGHIETFYGTGQMTGFVRANGRTIGSATSGASERANADTQALFQYLWTADTNLTVSTGRGASAAADWAANKTIALPDWRGRALAGLDDMGNSAAGRLTSTYFGTAATVLGAAAGSESSPNLLQTNLPSMNFPVTGTVTVLASGVAAQGVIKGSASTSDSNSTTAFAVYDVSKFADLTATLSAANAASGGSGTPFRVVPPTMLATIYIKM